MYHSELSENQHSVVEENKTEEFAAKKEKKTCKQHIELRIHFTFI
jgi:hypothetical protein